MSRRVSLRNVAQVLAFVLLSAAVATAVAPPLRSHAAAPVTGSNLATLTLAAAQAAIPSGQSTVAYVALESNSAAYVQAASNAARTRSVLLTTNGDATLLKSQLARWAVTQVRLVGHPTNFSSAFITSLQASYTVNTTRTSTDGLKWSEATASPTLSGAIYFADAYAVGSFRAASMLANQSQGIVVLIGATTSPADIDALINRSSTTRAYVVGSAASAPFDSSVLSQEAQAKLSVVESATEANLVSAGMAAYQLAVGSGASALSIVVSGDTNSDITASYLAGATKRPMGRGWNSPSQESLQILQALGKRATAPTLVALDATEAEQTAYYTAAQAVTLHPEAPFRVSTTGLSTTQTTLTVTAVTNATRYVAYGPTGAQVASSTTTKLVVPGTPVPLRIAAFNSAGTQLKSLQYKPSPYTKASDAYSFFAASDDGSGYSLRFGAGAGIPRLIRRALRDPADPAAPLAWQTIGITCNASFGDRKITQYYDVIYNVEQFAGTTSSCPTAGAAHERSVSEIWFSSGPAAQTAEGTKSRLKKMMDANRQARASSGELGPGDDWSDLLIRYNTFIPSRLIATGEFDLPRNSWIKYNGNGRTFNPNGSVKAGMDIRMKFGSDHDVVPTPRIGTTIKYRCKDQLYEDDPSKCVELGRLTQNPNTVMLLFEESTAVSNSFRIAVDSGNPFLPWAPGIFSILDFKFNENYPFVIGGHTRFPAHEMYWGLPQSEWNAFYQEPPSFLGPVCLAGTPGGDNPCWRTVFVEL